MHTEDKANLSALISCCKKIDAQGNVPATSGNFSVKSVDDNHIWVTQSGRHKGKLELDDFMLMSLDGSFDVQYKPSAEAALHLQIYALTHVGAVLHSHSLSAVKLAMLKPDAHIVLEDYELLKAFQGIDTHAAVLNIPVIENDQDMDVLAAAIQPAFENSHTDTPFVAYIIRGHGIYVWGQDLTQAANYLEALEYLFQLELTKLSMV